MGEDPPLLVVQMSRLEGILPNSSPGVPAKGEGGTLSSSSPDVRGGTPSQYSSPDVQAKGGGGTPPVVQTSGPKPARKFDRDPAPNTAWDLQTHRLSSMARHPLQF